MSQNIDQQVSRAWLSNYIPQNTVGYDYLTMLSISASGTKVLTYHTDRRSGNQYCIQIPSVRQFCHDDVIKWKHFPRYWPFVREIHRSPVNFPHKGQWRGALMFALICVWINGWVNNREAGDLRRYRVHYDVIIMFCCSIWSWSPAEGLSRQKPRPKAEVFVVTETRGPCFSHGTGDHDQILL